MREAAVALEVEGRSVKERKRWHVNKGERVVWRRNRRGDQ